MNSISLGDELSDDQLIFPDQKTEFSNQDVEDMLDQFDQMETELVETNWSDCTEKTYHLIILGQM